MKNISRSYFSNDAKTGFKVNCNNYTISRDVLVISSPECLLNIFSNNGGLG